MKKRAGGIVRVLATMYLIALHLALIYLIGEKVLSRWGTFPALESSTVGDPTEQKPLRTPEPVPTFLSEISDQPEPVANGDASRLIIPVEGVKREQLVDSFADARSNGRVHDAIDIMAPAATPVLAAVDGEIVKFFDSVAGGITIYQISVDRKFIYYYAHLQRRADDIRVGDAVKQGRTIGFIGDTGNAGAGNYHLHFSIARVTDPKRYWEGIYIDPYPYLRDGRAPEFVNSE